MCKIPSFDHLDTGQNYDSLNGWWKNAPPSPPNLWVQNRNPMTWPMLISNWVLILFKMWDPKSIDSPSWFLLKLSFIWGQTFPIFRHTQISSPDYFSSFDEWIQELAALEPCGHLGQIPPGVLPVPTIILNSARGQSLRFQTTETMDFAAKHHVSARFGIQHHDFSKKSVNSTCLWVRTPTQCLPLITMSFCPN